VSITDDNGNTWSKYVIGDSTDNVKAYSFGFKDDILYAASSQGLWKKNLLDNSKFEIVNLKIKSSLRNTYLEPEKVFCVTYFKNKLWVGTSEGFAVSENDGADWSMMDAYKSSDKTYSFPNPFSVQRDNEVKFYLKNDANTKVECSIYNFAMEKVRDINTSFASSGDHFVLWDGKDNYGKIAANGVYFYVLNFNGKKLWNKVVIYN